MTITKHPVIILLTLSLALLAPTVNAAQISTLGVVGLYHADNKNSQDDTLKEVFDLANRHKCSIMRNGDILDQKGKSLKIEANQYFIAKCDITALDKNTLLNWADELKKHVSNVVLLEGNMDIPNILASENKSSERSYIIKISHFNNLNPKQRNVDLKHLGELVSKVAPKYNVESQLHITNTYGMPSPNKITTIYYHSAAEGDNFRSNNRDILEKISNFNNDHIESFVYLFANSAR